MIRTLRCVACGHTLEKDVPDNYGEDCALACMECTNSWRPMALVGTRRDSQIAGEASFRARARWRTHCRKPTPLQQVTKLQDIMTDEIVKVVAEIRSEIAFLERERLVARRLLAGSLDPEYVEATKAVDQLFKFKGEAPKKGKTP